MEDNEGCHDTSSGKLCLCSHFRPAEPAPESEQTLSGGVAGVNKSSVAITEQTPAPPLNSSEVQPADSGGKTPEQMRVEIAKWCGTDNLFVLKKRGLYYRPGGAGYTGNINEAWVLSKDEAETHVYPHDEPVTMHPAPTPNYPTSLDAMATAEAMLTHTPKREYAKYLIANHGEFGAIFATALQRARAFLAVKEGASR